MLWVGWKTHLKRLVHKTKIFWNYKNESNIYNKKTKFYKSEPKEYKFSV